MRQSTARNNPGFFLKALFKSSGEVEIGIAKQIQIIKKRTMAILEHVDLDALPLESNCAATNLDNVLWRLQSAREKTFYLMYQLSKKDWAYQGQHPYRGKMSILDLARNLYHHDLEHLWKIRKLATGKLW